MTIPQAPFESRYFSASDGLMLHARDFGSALDEGVPVVCLPGLTRNSADFGPLASALASGRAGAKRRVLALDCRGRGLSDRDPNWRNYSLAVESADVLAVLTAAGIARATFIGTSRGGMLAMRLSAIRPAAIHGVVLNDIGPAVEPKGVARIRSYVGKLPPPASVQDAVDLLKRLMSEQFTHVSDAEWSLYANMTFTDPKGRFGSRYDPKLMNALDDLDLEQPMPTLWAQFDGLRNVPLLVIRGENSDVLSAETLAEMARRHPGCGIHIVEGQGHPPLLLDAGSIDRICSFVADLDAR